MNPSWRFLALGTALAVGATGATLAPHADAAPVAVRNCVVSLQIHEGFLPNMMFIGMSVSGGSGRCALAGSTTQSIRVLGGFGRSFGAWPDCGGATLVQMHLKLAVTNAISRRTHTVTNVLANGMDPPVYGTQDVVMGDPQTHQRGAGLFIYKRNGSCSDNGVARVKGDLPL
jgi:hypothetical protein